jgi:hypothetical protein
MRIMTHSGRNSREELWKRLVSIQYEDDINNGYQLGAISITNENQGVLHRGVERITPAGDDDPGGQSNSLEQGLTT